MNDRLVAAWRLIQALSLLFFCGVTGTALAQSPPGPGLIGIPADQYENDVERQSAIANQDTYDSLDPLCNPENVLGTDPNPMGPPSTARGICSSSEVFNVYLTVRELIHTANEIQGAGPRFASLGQDQEGLGTSLRWTAAEELAAQGSAASEFSNSQLSNLAARMNALRFGARGFTLSAFDMPATDSGERVAGLSSGDRRGGGASADSSASYSSWGGFLNGSYSYGNRVDTGREDAFDFDGSEVTAGLDYRFSNNLVFGGMFGWSRQEIDFDEAASDIRVVDGGMEIEGLSGIMFGLYQGDRFYGSASLGYQDLEYDIERRIKYASFNPDIGSANSVALSTPNGSILTGTLNFSYAFYANRFTFEPYINAEYRDITIDQFDEERSKDVNGIADEDAFNLTVAEQSYESFVGMVGLRFQYTFTPDFGVIVPYARIQAHKEVLNGSRDILAGYGEITKEVADPTADILTFSVPTDEVDEDYYTWAVGFSMVLRGGRQREYDGPITGGLMAFVQYESLEGKEFYQEQVISGGLRYEF